IFWLADAGMHIEAVAADQTANADSGGGGAGGRGAMGKIGGGWGGDSLRGEHAFRTGMVPADGVGVPADRDGSLRVRLLDDPETLARTVVLAGCAPVLSLWARSAERWYPGLRIHWTHANSMGALGSLARGEVHAAGVHLWD